MSIASMLDVIKFGTLGPFSMTCTCTCFIQNITFVLDVYLVPLGYQTNF